MENDGELTRLGQLRQRITEILMGLNGTDVDPELAYAMLAEYHNVDSKFLDVVHQVFTTGTTTGRRLAVTAFNAKVNVSKQADSRFSAYKAVSARSNLLHSWCAGNVAEETDQDADELFKSMKYTDGLLKVYRVHHDTEHDAPYWNGTAALVSILDPKKDEFLLLEDGGDFITWAGSRADLGAVIRLGHERRLIDPAALEALMAEQVSITVSLRNGVL